MRPIVDTHLDLAWNALGWGRDLTLEVSEINARESQMTAKARGCATTSLPELRRAGVAVCLATVLARSNPDLRPVEEPRRASVDHPSPQIAHAVAQGQLAYYRLLEQEGELAFLRTVEDLDAHWQRWGDDPAQSPIGVILAMEGADSIVRPAQAEAWFRDGLRSASLVHYGRNRYAVGTGQSGPLTPDGIALVREFERWGILLDVTHLSEPSFFEALDCYGGPVMASHNNCRALVPGDRQFSDGQIRRLIERGGVIGVALDAWMLYPGWEVGRTSRKVVGLQAVVDHVDHICQLAGNCRHVGIGSDLDGGYGTEQTPTGLDTIADLQKLAAMLTARGYGQDDVDAVFHGNWMAFFRHGLPRRGRGE